MNMRRSGDTDIARTHGCASHARKKTTVTFPEVVESYAANGSGAMGMSSPKDDRSLRQVTRRELLKLTPLIALGAFAVPKLQKPLLKAGLGFSDWASAALFRPGHRAPTFSDAEVTPFDKFPVNGY